MSSYTKNPFELLGDGVEDVEVLSRQQQQQKKDQKSAKEAAPKQQQQARTAGDRTRAQKDERRVRRDYPVRGGARGGVAVSGRAEPPRFGREREDGGDFSRASRGARRSERSRGGSFRGRGRQFDRHSATGLVDNEKKEKQGWGEPTTAEAEGEKIAKEDSNEALAEDKAEGAAAADAEPEEVVKTLDEYLAEKASKGLNVSLPDERKPNEGVDDAQWKGAVELSRDEEEYLFLGKEQAGKSKARKEKGTKVFVDIEQRFAERPRRGGFGGERGARPGSERGGRGGRGGRRGQQNGVNVEDNRAFPALGAK
ncbi:uncharacterized protein VTP21DRAFT_1213 [Calcarisporiella thermophila]|uniref:uncharacterized protein n=1 Tax=Calcarisporiella thermophila TaxID=911321 RepID=UPI0037445114